MSNPPLTIRRQSFMHKLNKQLMVELYTNQKWSIKEISEFMHLPERSVIAVVEPRETTSYCRCCGKELIQTTGHRQKEFCSSTCYKKWRRSNVLNSTAKHVCQYCGKEFTDPFHLNAKFCSRECRNNSYRK